MSTVTATVVGAEGVARVFEGSAAQALSRAQKTVQRLGLMVLARAKAKLSDDVLHVRTGRLRRSVNEETTVSGSAVTSTVGTPVVYGAAHERGFSGTVNVAEYERRIPHPAKGSAAVALVRAHAMRMKLPARSFLASSLSELRPQIESGLAEGMR